MPPHVHRVPRAGEVLALTAVTVLVSALAHSSTDLLVTQKLAEEDRRGSPSAGDGHAA